MRRVLAILGLVPLACSRDRGPVVDGISRVDVEVSRNDVGFYLDLKYTVRLAQPPLKDSQGVAIKAACQLGPDRIVDVGPPKGELVQGAAVDLEDNPFLLSTLPAKPSSCELTFMEASVWERRVIDRLCFDGSRARSYACPPNPVAGDGGATHLTVELLKVTPEDADDLGFPAHLTVEYRATAHREMPRGAYLVRETSCRGMGSDSTWHSELEHLRAGETMRAAQNTYRLGRPPPGTPCETSLGFSPKVEGRVTEIAAFCHRDTAITPGRCPVP